MRIEPTRIKGIVAVDADGGMGKDNALPWHLRKDLHHFKARTMNKPMVMGRKTFQSFKEPLPGRLHLVLTRDISFTYHHPDVKVFYTVRSLMSFVNGLGGTVWVLGGAEIFALLHSYIDEYHLTEIRETFEADTFFPFDYEEFIDEYELVNSVLDSEGDISFCFNTYVRR